MVETDRRYLVWNGDELVASLPKTPGGGRWKQNLMGRPEAKGDHPVTRYTVTIEAAGTARADALARLSAVIDDTKLIAPALTFDAGKRAVTCIANIDAETIDAAGAAATRELVAALELARVAGVVTRLEVESDHDVPTTAAA